MKIEILPRAEDDIIRQFRYYLVEHNVAEVAFRFRESAIESIEQLRPYLRLGALVQGSISGLRSWPVKRVRSHTHLLR